jgi:hypothetical protein
MANTAGRSTATTLVIPLRRGWSRWCRVLFAAARAWSFVTAPLRRQAFIHLARWSLVDELAGQPLGHTALYFESNFDGSMHDYIDVFLEAVPWRMRSVWAGGIGYPGLHPSDEYADWSMRHTHHVQHYYCGYEDATTSDVVAAVALDAELEAFLRRAPLLGEREFEQEYRRLLTTVERWL